MACSGQRQSTVSEGSAEETPPASVRDEKLRFLAMGDSYTTGQGVDASERWPVQLVRELRREGIAIADPEIIAKTGWTTLELAEAIDEADPQGPYDIVSLLIGVNSQYQGRDVKDYRSDLVDLLRRAAAFAGGEPGRVIVLSIPDWSATPFAGSRDWTSIAAEIEQFNAAIRSSTRRSGEEATRIGARYVDITPVSREAQTDPALVITDRLHPSGKMYKARTELVLPAARGVLADRLADR